MGIVDEPIQNGVGQGWVANGLEPVIDRHLPPARLRSRKYMSSTLLLVDEMGYDPMNREDASLFFRLVTGLRPSRASLPSGSRGAGRAGASPDPPDTDA